MPTIWIAHSILNGKLYMITGKMKIISLLIFLQVNVSFSQSYDSLRVFNISEDLKDLTIDEEEGLIYISGRKGNMVYNITKGEMSTLKIKEKALPEHPYYTTSYIQETNPSLDPVLLRKSLFTHNGEYLIYHYLKHKYDYIFVYKRHKKCYKLYSKFKNEINVNSVAVNRNLIMAVGSSYGQLRLWDIKGKKFIRQMKTNRLSGVVASIQFSEDNPNKIIISTGASKCIIMDIKTDQVYNTWHYGFIDIPGTESRTGQGAMDMNFANGDSLAIIGLTSRVHKSLNIWTTNNNAIYQESTDTIQPISYDRMDSVLFITDSTGTISEYNINQRKIINSFPSNQTDLKSLEFSDHGKYMVTRTGKGEIKVWLKNGNSTKSKMH